MLDTNVFVSAFVFPGGTPESIYRQVLQGAVMLVISPPLLAELSRVLIQKFAWDPTYAEEALSQLLRVPELVEPRKHVNDIQGDLPTTACWRQPKRAQPTLLSAAIGICANCSRGEASGSWSRLPSLMN